MSPVHPVRLQRCSHNRSCEHQSGVSAAELAPSSKRLDDTPAPVHTENSIRLDSSSGAVRLGPLSPCYVLCCPDDDPFQTHVTARGGKRIATAGAECLAPQNEGATRTDKFGPLVFCPVSPFPTYPRRHTDHPTRDPGPIASNRFSALMTKIRSETRPGSMENY